MKTFTCEIKDPLGIHARPAGLLVKTAADFESAVTLTAPNGHADCKRIMAVMRLSAKHGDFVTVTCEGPDENRAAETLKAFFAEHL